MVKKAEKPITMNVVVCDGYAVVQREYADRITYMVYVPHVGNGKNIKFNGIPGVWQMWQMSIYQYPRIDDLIAEFDPNNIFYGSRDSVNRFLDFERDELVKMVSVAFPDHNGVYQPVCLINKKQTMRDNIRGRIAPFKPHN